MPMSKRQKDKFCTGVLSNNGCHSYLVCFPPIMDGVSGSVLAMHKQAPLTGASRTPRIPHNLDEWKTCCIHSRAKSETTNMYLDKAFIGKSTRWYLQKRLPRDAMMSWTLLDE